MDRPENRRRAGEAGEDGWEGEAGKVGRRSAPRPAPTHLAESVLMEPVTSMSPARNSWYLVQAMAAAAGARRCRDPGDLHDPSTLQPLTRSPRGLGR